MALNNEEKQYGFNDEFQSGIVDNFGKLVFLEQAKFFLSFLFTGIFFSYYVGVCTVLLDYTSYDYDGINYIVSDLYVDETMPVLLIDKEYTNKNAEKWRELAFLMGNDISEARCRNSTVLVMIESGGGSIIASNVIADALDYISKRYNVKFVSYTETFCASAAYATAATCAEVYCASSAYMGSIGVFSSILNYRRLLESMGIDVVVVASSDTKTAGNPVETAEQREKSIANLQKEINAINDIFWAQIVEGRNGKVDAANREILNTGEIFRPEFALQYGLIDGIKNIFEMEEHLKDTCNVQAFVWYADSGVRIAAYTLVDLKEQIRRYNSLTAEKTSNSFFGFAEMFIDKALDKISSNESSNII